MAGQLESPDFLTRQALNSALFPKDDPTLRHATPATVAALTLQDVKDYYQQAFRPDLTTIVVIGNITPEQAKAVIAKYFGGWKAAGAKPDNRSSHGAANKPATTAVPNASRVQDEVTLAETLGLNRFNPDYYALELGNHVLGGGFYATRFYRDLREKGGLGLYRFLLLQRREDPRSLRGSVRLRSAQCLEGAQHRGARFEGHADRPAHRARIGGGKGAAAAGDSARGVER